MISSPCVFLVGSSLRVSLPQEEPSTTSDVPLFPTFPAWVFFGLRLKTFVWKKITMRPTGLVHVPMFVYVQIPG